MTNSEKKLSQPWVKKIKEDHIGNLYDIIGNYKTQVVIGCLACVFVNAVQYFLFWINCFDYESYFFSELACFVLIFIIFHLIKLINEANNELTIMILRL